MTGELLNIDNLSIYYSGSEPAVKTLSFAVKERQIVGIVGESGSGKTTLIRAILGLLPQGAAVNSGAIRFRGRDIINYSREEWRRLRGDKMALVFQDAGRFLNPIRRIGSQYIESIRCHSQLSKSAAYAKALSMLGKMSLGHPESIMRAYPFQLSGGMQQRVGIAMAMTMEPELLLADEPTSSLDAVVQAQVVRQMMQLRQRFNTGIIIVTHNIGVAAYMCDQIGVMQAGELVEWGDKAQVIDNPRQAYTRRLLAAVPELGGPCLVGR